jgi:hypothetical protein
VDGVFVHGDLESLGQANVTFADKFRLTGFSTRPTAAGLEVSYRWRCLRRPDREYWCFTHIVDGQGKVIGYLDHRILNGDPSMSAFKEGDVAIERVLFRSTEILPGEKYHFRLGLFNRESGERLPIPSSNFPLTDDKTAAIAPQ